MMNASMPNLWDVPAGPAPAGQVSNLVDPASQAQVLAIGIYILLPLMMSFVVLRIYTRVFVTQTFGTDDFLCIFTVVTIFAYSGVMLAILNLKPLSPLGRHIWDTPVAAFTDAYAKLLFSAEITVSFSLMSVRLSVLAFNDRIFGAAPGARRAIWVGIAAVTVFYMTDIIIFFAICVPRDGATWLSKISSGTCSTVELRNARSQGIFGLISDLYIIAIPIWKVSQLSIAPKRKAGVMAVFLTGILAVASSAGGLATREQVNSADPNYFTIPYLFKLCETCFGTICSCMPAITASLKPLASRVTSYWISIKKYSNTILSPTNHSLTMNPKEQLPEVPHVTLTGLRTFIDGFHATSGQTVLASDSSTAIQEDTILDYHDKLRDIHTRDHEL